MSEGFDRGLDKDFTDAISCNEMIKNCINERENKSLFFGIRNNYLNIYYKGASVVKIIQNKDNRLTGETAKKYLGSNESGYEIKAIEEIDIDKIINGIDDYMEGKIDGKKKNNIEKQYQQNIILENNRLESSDWFCIDMEYVMQREEVENDNIKARDIANYGRFDIIAISKKRDKNGKYKVALVELKVGTGSFGGISNYFNNMIKTGQFKVGKDKLHLEDKFKVGSGILGHFSDYVRYLNEPERFKKLKKEIINILKNYKELKLLSYDLESITEVDIEEEPQVVFLNYTGNENENVENIKSCFKRYLLQSEKGCSKYNVENMWEREITNKYIPRFKYLFKVGKPDGNSGNPIFTDLEISEAVILD